MSLTIKDDPGCTGSRSCSALKLSLKKEIRIQKNQSNVLTEKKQFAVKTLAAFQKKNMSNLEEEWERREKERQEKERRERMKPFL